MGIILEDAETGRGAAVGDDGRLKTESSSLTSLEIAGIEGRSFTMDTGTINLSSSAESGVFYVRNDNNNRLLQLSREVITLGASTGGSGGAVTIRFYANITGGTLFSAGTAIIPHNRNFGTAVPAQATTLAGAQGRTITGGTVISTLVTRDLATLDLPSSLILPVNTNLAISITPATGNTSMNLSMTVVILYF